MAVSMFLRILAVLLFWTLFAVLMVLMGVTYLISRAMLGVANAAGLKA